MYYRRYYHEYSGYVGPGLQRLAECYYHTGQTDLAQTVIEVQGVQKFLPDQLL